MTALEVVPVMAGVPLAILVMLGLVTLGPHFVRRLAIVKMITREPRFGKLRPLRRQRPGLVIRLGHSAPSLIVVDRW